MNNEFFHLFVIDQGMRDSRIRRPPHGESFNGRIEGHSGAYALRIDNLERTHPTDIEYLIDSYHRGTLFITTRHTPAMPLTEFAEMIGRRVYVPGLFDVGPNPTRIPKMPNTLEWTRVYREDFIPTLPPRVPTPPRPTYDIVKKFEQLCRTFEPPGVKSKHPMKMEEVTIDGKKFKVAEIMEVRSAWLMGRTIIEEEKRRIADQHVVMGPIDDPEAV